MGLFLIVQMSYIVKKNSKGKILIELKKKLKLIIIQSSCVKKLEFFLYVITLDYW